MSGAISKAERYRLLTSPPRRKAFAGTFWTSSPKSAGLIMLVLALSDQISQDAQEFTDALVTAARLDSAYDRAYYTGIVWERRARPAIRTAAAACSTPFMNGWMLKALQLFEQAEQLRAPGNDDSLLRWNTGVRFLGRHPELTRRTEDIIGVKRRRVTLIAVSRRTPRRHKSDH